MVEVPVVEGDGQAIPVVAPLLCADELTRSTTRVQVRLRADTEVLHYHIFFAHGATAPVNATLRRTFQTAVNGSVIILNYDETGQTYLNIESAVEKASALSALRG